jgi:transcriptional regulator of arginine metabolism
VGPSKEAKLSDRAKASEQRRRKKSEPRSPRPSKESPLPGSRSERRRLRLKILEGLLNETGFKTQAELSAALARQGFEVTQATISRDLRDLGARKVEKDGTVGYSLPEAPEAGFLRPTRDALMRRALAGSVLAVVSSGDLVLVKTLPGHAPYVASIVDEASIARVLGTVAGDDTVLVVAEETYGTVVREVLRDVAGITRSG